MSIEFQECPGHQDIQETFSECPWCEIEALRKQNERMKETPEASEAVRAVVYGETIDKLHVKIEALRKHADSLCEIVRMPNVEHVADAHNAAVRAIKEALRGGEEVMEPSWQELASSQDYERDAPGAAYRPSVDEMARRIKDATDDVKLHAELARLRTEVAALREALTEITTHSVCCDARHVAAKALRTTAPEPVKPSRPQYGGKYANLRNEVNPYAAELAEDVCEWTFDTESMGSWYSNCGETWTFNAGGPVENSMRFCNGCGKRVRIKEQE